ncbi:hypothetical protein B0E46_07290 [Rhodanobacter sp. B04]|uniref:conjugal transfer protein TraD n=1 Tax=Rhodanobacter sp. B04 TaxID=1945860 RepID=UPI000984176F|nr:conjugal transfer protein TraD [Rhodanobacter sp. B04]OOG64449.1 hypothetical protein B0E46_07290 [Rhodanobacter sp. B04]
MTTRTTLADQIARQTDRLAKLKAKAFIREKQEKAKAASASRRADAHRKITMGGLVIAAGADHLDPAELVGALLGWLHNRDDDRAARVRERGIKHLEAREAARSRS